MWGVLPVNGDYLYDRLPFSKHDKVDTQTISLGGCR